MTNQTLIIERTKTKSILYFLLFVLISGMFLYAAILIMLKEEPKGTFVIVFSFFIISLILFGVYRMINPLIKVFSNLPEFEIRHDRLIIYDNPKYNYILFKDMIGCKTFFMRYSRVIALYIKKESSIKGNLTKFKMKAWQIPKHIEKVVLLDLEFAKIQHEELERIINKMIENNREQ